MADIRKASTAKAVLCREPNHQPSVLSKRVASGMFSSRWIAFKDGSGTIEGVAADLVKVSPGCLFVPQDGDTVLVFSDGENVWVSSILEQVQPASAPLEIKASSIEMQCADMNISTTKRFHVESDSTLLCSNKMDIFSGELKIKSVVSKIVGKSLNFVAEILKSTADRLVDECDYSDHTVKEVENIAINRRMETIKGLDSHSVGTYTLNAKNLVKIDGKNIHMG